MSRQPLPIKAGLGNGQIVAELPAPGLGLGNPATPHPAPRVTCHSTLQVQTRRSKDSG
jgi:spore maturation protein SpmA